MKETFSAISKFIYRVTIWLVKSSKDPAKMSATFSGSAVFTVLITVAPLLGIAGLEGALKSIPNFLVALGQVLSAGYAVWGAFRKVKTTALGTNQVINHPAF